MKNFITIVVQSIPDVRILLVTGFILTLFAGCRSLPGKFIEADHPAAVFPDYSQVTVPVNIAPLNFKIEDKGDDYLALVTSINGDRLVRGNSGGIIRFPLKKWKKLLKEAAGSKITVGIFIRNNKVWTKYPAFEIGISAFPIDNHLVYRLIEPGFEIWNQMGIYQRNLENFDEKPVMVNSVSEGNCMNCHSFSANSSQNFMFHMRGKHAGTVIVRNGEIRKVNTKTDQTISAGVYPQWHPGGRFIAFSVNNIIQRFHALPGKKVEVQDTASTLILLDTETMTIHGVPQLKGKERLETFPGWSPDGKSLYYCSAMAAEDLDPLKMRYDLRRMGFDPESLTFGPEETVFAAADSGKSVSFPRVAPDGKSVVFCLSDYGNFSIWHKESDLCQLEPVSGILKRLPVNSDDTESYHSWSSSGRWMVFSSRRTDGLFTRPWITFIDERGNWNKPFMLPQKNPDFYKTFMKSYNVPELITAELELNPGKLLKIVAPEAEKVRFEP